MSAFNLQFIDFRNKSKSFFLFSNLIVLFNFRRNEKSTLIQCDFCSLCYHLDCLTPPLPSVPKDKWMCPAHVEHILVREIIYIYIYLSVDLFVYLLEMILSSFLHSSILHQNMHISQKSADKRSKSFRKF